MQPEPAATIQDPTDTRAQESSQATPALPAASTRADVPERAASALDAQLEDMMGDAPVCDGCGHITVRNGACYKSYNFV